MKLPHSASFFQDVHKHQPLVQKLALDGNPPQEYTACLAQTITWLIIIATERIFKEMGMKRKNNIDHHRINNETESMKCSHC